MNLDGEQSRSGQPRLQGLTPWLFVLAFAGIGGWSMLPPSPVPATSPADRFSAERAIEHVGVIAREPHPMGTAANARVRAYVVAELERLGIAVELQPHIVPDYYAGGEPVGVVNIIGRIPGAATTRAVALMAHYDTVPATPGGNDNSAAVAALLETGRALLAGPSLRNDVYLIFTDGEEPAPRFGATAFVTGHPAMERIGLVVNFEASGGSGPSVLVETSGPERWLIAGLAAADARPAAFSALTATTRLLGDMGTDFDTFRNAGLTGLHFAYLHGSPIYHTAEDSRDSVSKRSLQHHGEHALGIARRFGTLDLDDPGPAGGVVFFAAGPLFVRYPATRAVPFALLALAAGAIGWWRVRRSAGPPAVVLSVLRAIGAGLLAAVTGTLLWLLVAAIRPTPGVLESYLWFGCILAPAAWVAARTSPRREHRERLAVVWIWIALSVLTAFGRPGFSCLFTWPALAGAVALCIRADGSRAMVTLRFALVAAPTLILATPVIDVFLQLAQPRPGNPDSQMLAAVALPLLFAVAALGLLRTAWPRALALPPPPRVC